MSQPTRSTGSGSPSLLDRLDGSPALVFSRSGRLIAQTRLGAALFGDTACPDAEQDTEVCVEALLDIFRTHRGRRCYRHPGLGPLELVGDVFVDPAEHRLFVIYEAVAGTGTVEKLQLLATSTRHHKDRK